MSHFDAESWSDFVRGAAPEPQSDRMRRHLEEGCAECATRVTVFEAVRSLFANERALGPTPGVVRSVKALVRPRLVSAGVGRPPRRFQLALDCRPATRAAGFRGHPGSSHRLVFTYEDLAVDLQVVQESANGARVLGELVASDYGHLAAVPFTLFAGDEVVAEGVTGELGEFDLPSAEGESLKLRFELEETFELEIPAISS